MLSIPFKRSALQLHDKLCPLAKEKERENEADECERGSRGCSKCISHADRSEPGSPPGERRAAVVPQSLSEGQACIVEPMISM